MCNDNGTPKPLRGRAVVVGPRRAGPWVGHYSSWPWRP
jgi:hypothetical protein